MKVFSRNLIALPLFVAFAVGNLMGRDPVILAGSVSTNEISDPMQARSDARKSAVKFRERGYLFTPVFRGDNNGSETTFDLELTAGTDCVIIIGIDEAMPDVDLYVKDEHGNNVTQDTRPIRRACVEFPAAYNGKYTVTIKAARSAIIGNFAVLVGLQASGY